MVLWSSRTPDNLDRSEWWNIVKYHIILRSERSDCTAETAIFCAELPLCVSHLPKFVSPTSPCSWRLPGVHVPREGDAVVPGLSPCLIPLTQILFYSFDPVYWDQRSVWLFPQKMAEFAEVDLMLRTHALHKQDGGQTSCAARPPWRRH